MGFPKNTSRFRLCCFAWNYYSKKIVSGDVRDYLCSFVRGDGKNGVAKFMLMCHPVSIKKI